MVKEYKLAITIVLAEDSHILDCLRADESKRAVVLMSPDAAERVRDNLMIRGFDELHYDLGNWETSWELVEILQ